MSIRATDASEKMTKMVDALIDQSRHVEGMCADRLFGPELAKAKEKAHRVRNELLRAIAKLEAPEPEQHLWHYDGDQDVVCSCGATFGAGDGYTSVEEAESAAADHVLQTLRSTNSSPAQSREDR